MCQGGARSVTEQPLVEQFTVTRPSFKAEAEPSLKTNGHAPSPGSVCEWQSVKDTDREETNSGTNNLVIVKKQNYTTGTSDQAT